MNCFDDSYVINNRFKFQENIDYLDNDIDISNFTLMKCLKHTRYNVDSFIPSTDSQRLNYICWRRLYKSLNNLSHTSPHKINWLKDNDINWLYGPKYDSVDEYKIPKPKTASQLCETSSLSKPQTKSRPVDIPTPTTSTNSSTSNLMLALNYSDSESEVSNDNDSIFSIPNSYDHQPSNVIRDSTRQTNSVPKKSVRFNCIVHSREIINGFNIDYDFLDENMLNN